MKHKRKLTILVTALAAVAVLTFALVWYSGAGPLVIVASTVLATFVVYAMMNLPGRYRRHGWGLAQQAVDHERGLFGNSYQEDPLPPERVVKVGRNDPCPCGSGLKFKQCCGTA